MRAFTCAFAVVLLASIVQNCCSTTQFTRPTEYHPNVLHEHSAGYSNHDIRIVKLKKLLAFKMAQQKKAKKKATKLKHIMRKLRGNEQWAKKHSEKAARHQWKEAPPTPSPVSACGQPVASCCGDRFDVKQARDCKRCLAQRTKRNCLLQMVPLLTSVGSCFVNISVPDLCKEIAAAQ
jgi:hypothetical protein